MSQAEKKDLYKKTSEKTGVPEELIASVGDFIFKSWADWQKQPDNLRLRIRGLGVQIVRKKKMHKELDKMFNTTFDYINEDNNNFVDEDQFLRYQDQKEWLQNMLNLKVLYKKYSEQKAKTRQQRDAVQRPLKDVLEAARQQKQSEETRKSYFKEP